MRKVETVVVLRAGLTEGELACRVLHELSTLGPRVEVTPAAEVAAQRRVRVAVYVPPERMPRSDLVTAAVAACARTGYQPKEEAERSARAPA
ncbi:MAG: hypothetical protein KGJ86_00495 [Chloroflexota bacterium]|nr:hypothetical protein [Chloroflexota bacterium]